MVKENLAEYCALTDEAKAKLVEEFADFRVMKTVGTHISGRSKISHVTHTLKAVENKLDNLKCCMGVKTLFYTTRGTADLPLQGIAYCTKGVAGFMSSMMELNTGTIIGKVEGQNALT
ncbi:hypothetical protein JVT61DRAFT_1647 [Boletus reticuloceps]|uniref:Uncharacterized protein n=1 Tax=Boletus reticuloceps TaxID=495285 RepID=A0A8I3ABI4_9AGAM|nr:hypothetical protein JVT61DRAFT_1647 [Boletus reticuloceps]